MQIITQESLAETFIKNILATLFETYSSSKVDHENATSFDEYVWERLSELGHATYEQIGEMYGDLDGAINEVME